MTLPDCENLIGHIITMYAYDNQVEIQGVKVKAERDDSIFANISGKSWECEISLKAK